MKFYASVAVHFTVDFRENEKKKNMECKWVTPGDIRIHEEYHVKHLRFQEE